MVAIIKNPTMESVPCSVCQRVSASCKHCDCGSDFCFSCSALITSETVNPRCPICDKVFISPVSRSDVQSLSSLKSVRVIQRTLIYVIGLAPSIASESLLATDAYFGQYGLIRKLVVNTSNPYNSPQGVSYSAYVNFTSEIAAISCIKAITGFKLHGRELGATFGTTKYCTSYIKGTRCHKPGCLYLHELGSKIDSFTREDIQHNKHVQAHNSVFRLFKVEAEPPLPGHVLPFASAPRARAFSHELFNHTPQKDILDSDLKKPRLSSVDSPPKLNSRFGFKFMHDSDDEASSVPKYLEELVNHNSPGKKEVKVPCNQVAEILKEPWATDVLLIEKHQGDFLIKAA